MNDFQRKTVQLAVKTAVDSIIWSSDIVDNQKIEFLLKTIYNHSLTNSQVFRVISLDFCESILTSDTSQKDESNKMPGDIRGDWVKFRMSRLRDPHGQTDSPTELLNRMKSYLPNFNPFSLGKARIFMEYVKDLASTERQYLIFLRECFLELTPMNKYEYTLKGTVKYSYRVGTVPFNLNKCGPCVKSGAVKDLVREIVQDRVEMFRRYSKRLESEVAERTRELEMELRMYKLENSRASQTGELSEKDEEVGQKERKYKNVLRFLDEMGFENRSRNLGIIHENGGDFIKLLADVIKLMNRFKVDEDHSVIEVIQKLSVREMRLIFDCVSESASKRVVKFIRFHDNVVTEIIKALDGRTFAITNIVDKNLVFYSPKTEVLIKKKFMAIRRSFFNDQTGFMKNVVAHHDRFSMSVLCFYFIVKNTRSKSEEIMEGCLKIAPEMWFVLVLNGLILREKKQYTAAMTSLEKAIRIDPKMFIAYDYIGSVFTDLNQYEKAIQNFEKVIDLKPSYPRAYTNMGHVFKKTKQYFRAIECYENSTKADPTYYVGYFNIGFIYHILKKYDKVVEFYERSVSMHPGNGVCYNNLGAVYLEMKQYDKAKESFKKSIAQGYKQAEKNLDGLKRLLSQPASNVTYKFTQ